MVVADDDLDALGAGILHFVNGLDAAVQRDDEADTVVRSPVQGLVREAVAFVVAVRDIEVYLLGKVADKGIDLGHGSGSVYVIVSIDQNLLSTGDGLVQPFYGFVHIGHEEGVVEVFQAGAEETAGLFKGLYAALDKEVCQNPVYTQFSRQLRCLLRIRSRNQAPLSFRNAHSYTKIGNLQNNYKQEMMISSVRSSGVMPVVSRVMWAAFS